ncbi:hypothetical protein [Stenotrophomonas rhizophila]|uniref:hypothetical protein n=2 Tax=Stenotrophomonas rhizophila TaxID=216778 RepID=UPI0010C0A021|nr:hypothetical protein [Stenotrophomonas rhizophila]TKK10280.1 hypothetical protein SrhCFBP13529_06605 [Stenotrophomonas rhizophila]
MRYELWIEPDQEQTFCMSGPHGDSARALLRVNAKRVWTVNAQSHFEAMTKYHQYMGWGPYVSAFPDVDNVPFGTLNGEEPA